MSNLCRFKVDKFKVGASQHDSRDVVKFSG